jgi:adenylate cyclase
MLTALLGADPSLAHPLQVVIDRTGGNPFFVEEVVRSLVENGTLAGEPGNYRLTRPVDAIGVPPTVQATLAARIDRLTDGDKAVLQMAAVIGRNFTEPVLGLVSGHQSDELSAITDRLRAAEFIQAVTFDPVDEYRFWHPLTQEVAYRGLLRERRTALHAAAAQAIVSTEGDRLDEQAALIATHWKQAGDHLQAARWNQRAAEWALRSDVGEATRRWRATIALLEAAEKTGDSLRLGIAARHLLIRYGARTGMSPGEAKQLYTEAKSLADDLRDQVLLAAITNAYGAAAMFRGEVREGRDLVFEAAQLAESTGDTNARSIIWVSCGTVSAWTGTVAEGHRALDRVVEATGGDPEVGRGYGYSPLARICLSRAELLALTGRLEEARGQADRGVHMTRERREPESLAWTLSIYPRLARTVPEFEEALKHASEAVRIAEDIGHPSVHVTALGAVGIAKIGLGRFEDAAATLETALSRARDLHVALFEEATLLTHLARARTGLGDGHGAERTAGEAVAVARRQGARVLECLALLTRARVRRATGHPVEQVEADLAAALDLARITGATAYEGEIEAEQRAGI